MKKIKMSKIVVLGLCLLMLFTASCGSKGGGSDDAADSGTSTTGTGTTLNLGADEYSVLADGVSTTLIKVTIKGTNNTDVADGTKVDSTTTAGTLSADSADTTNNEATVILTSGTDVETATVTATFGSINQNILVTFERVPIAITLGLSQLSVKSDNSDAATVTAMVKDKNNAIMNAVEVSFTSTGGLLSASTALTDDEGKATIEFKAGDDDKSNRIVNIMGTVKGLPTKTIPCQIAGTEIKVTNEKTSLDLEGEYQDNLVIKLQDAGLKGIYDQKIDINVDPLGSLNIIPVKNDTNDYSDFKTDVNGQLLLTVSGGKTVEDITMTIQALGTKVTQSYSVTSSQDTFAIIVPSENPWAMNTNQIMSVIVRAVKQTKVRFSTSFGYWEQNGTFDSKVVDVPVTDGTATARMRSTQAGLASVQVVDANDPAITDALQIAISAPSSEATQISLQASATVVAPSTGDVKNVVTLTATVKNVNDQVVGNSPVNFSIETTTGGGESISPVIVYTDSTGVATTTFTSGTISTGAQGINVIADVVGKTGVSASIKVIIGGTAGSLLITTSTKISNVNNNTAYSLPMSVIVADANGNPMTGTEVSVGVWPIEYRTGYWIGKVPYIEATKPNEDINRNLILDDGEDENGDGKLTPPASAAGTVPSTVITDENGVAEFNLIYLKNSAVWIKDELRASTKVSGSETQGIVEIGLPFMKGEEESLPHSPYYLGDVPEQPPEPQDMTLSANPMQVVADGEAVATLKSVVTDVDGNFLSNIKVFFSSTGGTLSADHALTVGADGAKIELTGTRVGYVTVYAEVAGAYAYTLGYLRPSINIEFIPGPPSSKYSTITAAPPNLSADGVSTSTITVKCYDDSGNKALGDEPIKFIITGDGMIDPIVASTDSRGMATAEYTAPATTGIVTIKAVLAGPDTEVGTITIPLIEARVGSVSVTAGDNQIIANGASTTTISALITDDTGKTVKDGTTVTFNTTAGTINTTTSITTSGVATVTLTSADNVGLALVTATAGGVSGDVSVTFVSGVPAKIITSLYPTILTVGENQTARITAIVMDKDNNYVVGEVLTFTILNASSGLPVAHIGSLSANVVSTNSFGTAEVTYTPPSNAQNDVKINIKASNGITGPDNDKITLNDADVSTITLSANPENIPVNETGTIYANVSLEGGGGAEGTIVTFKIITPGESGNFIKDDDTVIGKEATAATNNGLASVTLKSGTLVGEDIIIQASVDNDPKPPIIADTTVRYTSGKLTLLISPNSMLGAGIQQATISGRLEKSGKFLAGEEIKLTMSDSSMGTLDDENVTTDADGNFETTFKGGTKGGTLTITAAWEATQISADLTIQPPPAFIKMAVANDIPNVNQNPEFTTIAIKGTGGQSTSRVIFAVEDIYGSPVVDGYRVDFLILTGPDGGEEISPVTTETKDGRVSTVLRSGFKSGPVSIKATYYYDTNISTTSSQIAVGAGPPVGEEFSIAAEFLNLGGAWYTLGLEDKITIIAGDIYGNAVPDGTAISFKTYNTGGVLDPTNEATVDGDAISILTSASNPKPMEGFLSVTAEAVNGGRTTRISALSVYSEPGRDYNIIYAATNGGGVYKSIDSGETWTNKSRSSTIGAQNWIAPYVNDVMVDPDDPNVIYAATGYLGSGNIYRSLDGGNSWNSNNIEEISGIFAGTKAVLKVLCDDDGPYVWAGTNGDGLFYSTCADLDKCIITGDKDKEYVKVHTYFDRANGLGIGKIINDIVKVEGTHGATADLYAATASGLYRSSDGGENWTDKDDEGDEFTFSGDHLTTLALDPKFDDNKRVYCGTLENGVWRVSRDGDPEHLGAGMGKGLSATTPLANKANRGTGSMEITEVLAACKSENWIVECITGGEKAEFTIIGSVSGNAKIKTGAVMGNKYQISDDAVIYNASGDRDYLSFKIVGGTVEFESGDMFTFSSTRDPGAHIKDLLVAPIGGKNYLYAITYFEGALEPHAVGNVYRADIETEPILWEEVNAGLPQYDPPDDTTLFAQHSLALTPGNGGRPSMLLIGGEGISFNKALNGLEPVWQSSKTGLTNLVMARMPVLFSGMVTMKIYGGGGDTLLGETLEYSPNGSSGGPECPTSIDNGNPLGADTGTVRYHVLVEDDNGNPPPAGSTFSIKFVGGTTIRSVDYPDTQMYQGTYRDHADPTTYLPYDTENISIPVCEDTEIEFKFCAGSQCVFGTETIIISFMRKENCSICP